MYDPAIGRFTGVDPIADKFPELSTYNYASNKPINSIDLHGLQAVFYMDGTGKTKTWSDKRTEISSEERGRIIEAAKSGGRMAVDEIPIVGEVVTAAEGNYSGIIIGMIPFGKQIRKFAGGAYNKLFKSKKKIERHHMPSRKSLNDSSFDEVNPNTDAPAIEMEFDDHLDTGSWGNRRTSKKFRQKEKELLDKGDFEGAQQLGIDDVRKRHGDKYDGAINQMLEYTKNLFKKNKDN